MLLRRLTLLFSFLLSLTSQAGIKDRITVAIFSINDFHGAFVRDEAKGIPGAAAVRQTLDSLKRVYPYHLTGSAGDNFGGSYFYNATRRQSLLPQFFSDLGIRLSAVGNHEFDEGQAAMAEKWADTELCPRDWSLRYVCANIRDSAGHTPTYMQPYATEKIRISHNRTLDVAFVGLIASSTPQQVSVRRIAGLSFSGKYSAVIDSLKRTAGFDEVRNAHIRLLLTHIGTRMNPDTGVPEWEDKDADELERINDTLFHGILTSHTHRPVCGRINRAQYPVVQANWHGTYIGLLKVTIDTLDMRVSDVEPALVRVSPKHKLTSGRRLQTLIDRQLDNTRTLGGTPLGLQLTTAARTFEHNRNDKYRQTETGRMVCAAYAEAYRRAAPTVGDTTAVVVGCSHFGSIRSDLTAGPVRVLDIGEILPFANALKAYRLSGKQLREFVNFGLHNEKYGWLQTSGLDIKRDSNGQVAALRYSPDGAAATARIPIADNTPCILVADEFMVHGGDGYDPDFFRALQPVEVEGMPATTDAFIDYLRQFPLLK